MTRTRKRSFAALAAIFAKDPLAENQGAGVKRGFPAPERLTFSFLERPLGLTCYDKALRDFAGSPFRDRVIDARPLRTSCRCHRQGENGPAIVERSADEV